MPTVPRQHKGTKLGLSSRGRYLLGLLLVGMFWLPEWPLQTRASTFQGGTMPAQAPLQQNTISNSDPNDNCLMCHSDPDFKGSFQNGELLSLYVDSGEYEQSVHGPAGLNCVACHTNVSRYPHHTEEQITCIECHGEDGGEADTSYVTLRVQLLYSDNRELTLDRNESCRSCHEQEYEVAGPSAHVRVFEGGNRDSATCIDCHGSHSIADPQEPRAKIVEICGDCHEAVYSTYCSSIHGMALMSEDNPDVPTCVDCHGVHNVRGPRDPTYRNDSVTICGDCHSDHLLMAKYDVSAEVYQTYQNDFHGRTVDFFRRYESDNPSNKAVCFDCHGIHNIRQCSDSLSTVHAGNLHQTCQQCHSGAGPKFVSSFNHDVPTWEKAPFVSGVNLTYSILTPATIGGFLVYIGLDVGKRWYDKRRRIRQARILAERELEEDFTHDI